MADKHLQRGILGDGNQGFQLNCNSGHVDVSYHIAHSGVLLLWFSHMLPFEAILASVCPC